MYNRFFNSQTKSINSAALILATFSFLSGLLGFLRDRLLAGRFGAGDELDIYYAAFRIPDFVATVFLIGSISAAIIPIFSEHLVRSRREAWEFFTNFLNITLFLLIVVCIILIIFVPAILKIIVPGFSAEKREMTIILTRIMFLSPIFLGVGNIVSSVLRVFRRFLVAATAPLMYNIGIICGILFFTPFLGIVGLAWGVVFGAFLHLLIQLPILFKLGFRFQRAFNFLQPAFIKAIKLTIPRAIGLAANQINLIVITAIGSTLTSGSVAVFNLANNLQNMPMFLIGSSLSVAAFPFLSIYFFKKNREKLINEFSSVFRKIIFFIIPISFLMFILRTQIVRIILGAGKFSWADTQLTAACLGAFSFGIFAYTLSLLISKFFYSFQNTKIPALVTILTIIINICLCFLFVWLLSFDNPFKAFFAFVFGIKGTEGRSFSVVGLPLASSVSGIFQLIFSGILLYKKIGDFRIKEIFVSFAKIITASFVMGLLVCGMVFLTEKFIDTRTFLGVFSQTLLAGVSGIVVYTIAVFLLRSSEISEIKEWK